jgi:glyoxylase-like metal-dependent hydrolase (beta-lactamase superfamily II)
VIQRALTLLAALLALTGVARSVSLEAQAGREDLTIVEVRPTIYMIAGAGGNVVVHTGLDGVILVDTGRADRANALLAEIQRLTPQPIRYIINTSADADHVGGNPVLSAAGKPLYAALGDAVLSRRAAPILAEEHVLTRMGAPVGSQPAFPQDAWPTSTYSADAGEPQRKLVMNGDAVRVVYQRSAHTDGDSLVYFQRSDVLVAGDLLDVTRFPVIDRARGGSITGTVDGLNRIIDMTFQSVPFPWQDDGTFIVPGHGRLCGTDDVTNYRDMVSIVRDRIGDLIKKGRTLAQVQQANPTAGYRRQFGSDSGSWTTAMFVEAVYQSLIANKGASR